MKYSQYAVLIAAIFIRSLAFATCDLCSVYVAQQQRSFEENTFTAGLSEQFTSLSSLQSDGSHVPNEINQYLKSSITQVFGRYDFSRDFALQTNIPIISRRFRRVTEDGMAEKGSVSGVGDISLLALYSPIHIEEPGKFFRLTLQGGLKFSTGDARELGNEHSPKSDVSDSDGSEHSSDHDGNHDSHDEHSMNHDEEHNLNMKHSDEHALVPEAVHAHSLALGSGSLDYVTGVNFFGQSERWIAAGNLQYLIRNKGSFDYEYADDFLWDVGVGRYLYLEESKSVALRVNFLGETKGFDKRAGKEESDTAVTTLFAGPEINFTSGSDIFGLAALDLPIFVNNTGTGLAADYRFRLAVMYRF